MIWYSLVYLRVLLYFVSVFTSVFSIHLIAFQIRSVTLSWPDTRSPCFFRRVRRWSGSWRKNFARLVQPRRSAHGRASRCRGVDSPVVLFGTSRRRFPRGGFLVLTRKSSTWRNPLYSVEVSNGLIWGQLPCSWCFGQLTDCLVCEC